MADVEAEQQGRRARLPLLLHSSASNVCSPKGCLLLAFQPMKFVHCRGKQSGHASQPTQEPLSRTKMKFPLT
jgi:hypothetical protein